MLDSHSDTSSAPAEQPQPTTAPEPPPQPEPSSSESAGSSRFHFFFPEGNPEELPQHLLVVYNSKDSSSRELADYYANRRGIPPERVLGIPCSTAEEITRDEYKSTLREPISSYIYGHGWMKRQSVVVQMNGRPLELLLATSNDIWAMVLMRGIPVKIAEDPSISGGMQAMSQLQTNAAAVDSELALLPAFGLPEGGFVPNAFYDGQNTGTIRVGPELATKLILVTRLDGPTPDDVRRMIDDTLYAEANRLAGRAVVDSRGLNDPANPYTSGDTWLRSSDEALLQEGWPVTLDTREEVLPATDPLNHIGLYLGWYTASATGPWVTPPDRFVRGAIAYHLHSFSAVVVRSATAAWVGPLIAHGAAATMGTVYEPYLDLTPHLDIFTKRLLAGNYFSEAAYASEKALSWMLTVIGDPLYRPFLKTLDAAVDSPQPVGSEEHGALLLQQVRLGISNGQIDGSVTSLEHELDVPNAIAQEGLGDLLAKINDSTAVPAAIVAYRKASLLFSAPIDRIRIGLKIAGLDESHSRLSDAQGEWKSLRHLYPEDAVRFGVPGAEPASAPGPRATAVSSIPVPKPPRPPQPPTP